MVGHYTFYSRAVVKNPKLVSVVEGKLWCAKVFPRSLSYCFLLTYLLYPLSTDVFCQDYIGGEGHEFFKDAEEFSKHWNQQEIGTKRCRKSLLAWAVPAGKAKGLPDAIDLMGDFPHSEHNALAEDTRTFDGVRSLEDKLMLGALRPLRQSEGNLFLRASTGLNTVMFRGMQYTQSKTKNGGKPRITQLNTGHWGKNVSFLFQYNCYL